MFLGHFGVAFAAKKAAPKTSLGTLLFAAQFADLLWPLLLLAGIEKVRIMPGLLPISPFEFTSYPISHSLVAQIGWGCLLGLVYFAVKRDGKSALLIGALVPTHWVLDFIAHRPDMPIYPSGPKFGLGMWESLPLTLIVEYVVVCRGRRTLPERHSGQRCHGEMGVLVARSLAWRALSGFRLRPAPAKFASARAQRTGDVDYRAMGRMG